MTPTDDLPITALAAAYDLGDWKSVQLIPGGKSQHYRVATTRGEYVLRRSYGSKTIAMMRFEHELIAHLRSHGFPALEVVSTRRGATWLELQDRLYSITVYVDGSRYQPGNRQQLLAVAQALATYHQIVESFKPSVARPREALLHEVVRDRLARVPTQAEIDLFAASFGRHDAQIAQLLESLPYAVARAEAAGSLLDRVYERLPLLTIHGGCRRGSALFEGDTIIAMLDFDSARLEARIMDLAIALHDYGKIFGERGSADFKVPLDLAVIAQLLDAYNKVSPLETVEMEALPTFLVARPLKRALGKLQSMINEQSVGAGHVRKTAQEIARVRWIESRVSELQSALTGASQLHAYV